jgi:hypothetical protein
MPKRWLSSCTDCWPRRRRTNKPAPNAPEKAEAGDPTQTPTSQPTAESPIEPTTTAQENEEPIVVERALRLRGVHKNTGLMEWLESKQPEVEAATQWKYPLDTV